MRDGWRQVALGEVCTLTKGTTPTQKAVPGPYPLVVTAADFLSSDTYQFDGEAVCVPMVSSTGHGHASLKRVHYASGKFAVANIITALEARPDAAIDMRYLWLVLDHGRADIIVPLMKGTANVSLSQRALSGARILLPPLDEQRRIVDLIGALDDAIEAADMAVAGHSRVARSIAADVWRTGETKRVRELGRLVTGATPSTKDPEAWSENGAPFVTPSDIPWDGTQFDSRLVDRFVSHRTVESSTRSLSGVGVLQVCIGATIGKVGVTTGPALFNQQVNAVMGLSDRDARLVAASMASPQFQHVIKQAAGSSTMPLVSKGSWANLEIRLPSGEVADGFINTLMASDEVGVRANQVVAGLRETRSNILPTLLSGEHEIPESYDEVLEVSA